MGVGAPPGCDDGALVPIGVAATTVDGVDGVGVTVAASTIVGLTTGAAVPVCVGSGGTVGVPDSAVALLMGTAVVASGVPVVARVASTSNNEAPARWKVHGALCRGSFEWTRMVQSPRAS